MQNQDIKIPVLYHEPIHLLREDSIIYTLRKGEPPRSDIIICGDSLEVLRSLPDNYVQSIITSPPYFNQRDYSHELQIGHERFLNEYVSHLRIIFSECKRVLAESGILWLNIGDKYTDGELMGVPWEVALSLKASGWILRSDIIWHKPNAMPSSVKNRPTPDHEYLFMFTKSRDYYYNADAIREPHVTFTDQSKMKGGRSHFGVKDGTPEKGKNQGNSNLHRGRWDQAFHPLGRNKRTVWSIPLSKFRDAHFAVFPESLVETCIKASSKPTDLILDPFCGSGTSLAVARKLSRRFIGIDINSDYCKIAQNRVSSIQVDLLFGEDQFQSA